MGTAPSIRLTKPRISALILEGTAATVSVVLVLWLLLWFIRHPAQKNTIEAFYVRADGVPAEDAPFQAADARLFSDHILEAKPGSDLNGKVRESIGRTGPVILYVSAPLLATGPAKAGRETWVKDLIGEVCSGSAADVILALDLSPIDTDRELGVYGNAPYQELLEAISGAKSKKRIFILTAAAPAQKSWSSEAVGHSIFAYYLRKGLGGEAVPSNAEEPATVTVDDLYRYVRDHVREWVRVNRHGSIQTPMLLKILPDPKDSATVVFRAVPEGSNDKSVAGSSQVATSDAQAKPESQTKVAASESQVKPESQAKPESQPKAEPVPSEKDGGQGRSDPAKLLIAEWKRHDGLSARRPYRLFPGTWRTYQSSLLRTERRLRAARLEAGPGAMDGVREALEDARGQADALEQGLRDREAMEARFRFRPVLGEGEDKGKDELDRALRFLTGRGADAELIPAPPPAPKAAEPAGEVAKGPDQPAPAKEAPKNTPPPGLSRITPETYLELQLLAWAYRFVDEFGREGHFVKESLRGQALREIVRARADAELALALDRRGLGWIEPIVRRGDEARREIQDELFSGIQGGRPQDRWREKAERVGTIYKQALRRSTEFQDARETWEQAAAELPALAEWDIRLSSYKAGASQSLSDPVPDVVKQALDSFRGLSALLNDKPDKADGNADKRNSEWFGNLTRATAELQKSLGDLRLQFQQAIDRLELQDQDWTALDAALRTPSIRWDKREKLLARLRTLDQEAVRAQPGSGNDPSGQVDWPADPGFWSRAAGLAQLDLTLSRIALKPETTEDDAPAFRDLGGAISQATMYPGISAGAGTDRPFPEFTAAVFKGAGELKDFSPALESGPPKKPNDVEPMLSDVDRRARLLDAWKLNPTVASRCDDAVERYRRFSRYAALVFHQRRLREDYAEDLALGDLAQEIKSIAALVPVRFDPEPVDTGGHPIKVHAGPARTIRLDNWRGRLEVDSQPPKDEDGWIPSGKAFVGLVVPRGLEVDGGVPETAIPGRLVPVGTQLDGASTTTPETYQLIQKDYERSTTFTLRAVAFYRGRADDDGAAVVDVLPTRSPDLVKVSIARDTEAWKARYRDADPAEFKDQFANQQQRGYMHLGKGLECLLRVKNLTPEKLNVRCAIESSNPADPQKKEPEVIPLSLEAAGKGGDEKVLTPVFVQLDPAHPEEKRMLKVTVTALDETAQAEDPKRKVQRSPFEVRFAQFGINDYMDISTDFIRNCKDHPAHPYCYVVNYRRMDDDKFTDPIRADEWQCEILQRSDAPKPTWIRPGLGLGFHYFDGPPNVAEYKWSGRIGPERFEGEGRNRWRPVAPKP